MVDVGVNSTVREGVIVLSIIGSSVGKVDDGTG